MRVFFTLKKLNLQFRKKLVFSQVEKTINLILHANLIINNYI